MTPVRFHLCIALACAMLSAGVASADEPASADLDIHQFELPAAMTVMRTMASADKVIAVDEDTIRVVGAPESLAMAAVVLEMIERPADAWEQVTSRELADGTDIAGVALKHASLREVTSALREMRIWKYATSDQRQMIMVRDTKEKVQAALELIEALEQEASSR